MGPSSTAVGSRAEQGTESLPSVRPEAGQAFLAVTRGPNQGATFSLQAEVMTIGRHTKSDVFLADRTVSRGHAEIRRRDGRLFIQDVGSLNGTYVNGRRVDEAELASGDELQIGRYKLLVLAG